MSLVLGLLMLGGSSAAVWAGITDPEGGVWGGLRNLIQQAPNVKHTSAISAAFIDDLANVSSAVGSGGGGGSGSSAPAGAVPTAVYGPPSASSTHVSLSAPGLGGSNGAIIATARTWLGVPYKWGGTTRKGVDCSGFVQNVYAAHGIRLPRVSAAQAHAGKPRRAAEAQPADLVFFGVPAHHVGIVLGGGMMIHAPYPGKVVRVERIAGAVKGAPITYRNVIG